MFSCEFCEISKNTFFTEHLRAIASALRSKESNQCASWDELRIARSLILYMVSFYVRKLPCFLVFIRICNLFYKTNYYQMWPGKNWDFMHCWFVRKWNCKSLVEVLLYWRCRATWVLTGKFQNSFWSHLKVVSYFVYIIDNFLNNYNSHLKPIETKGILLSWTFLN